MKTEDALTAPVDAVVRRRRVAECVILALKERQAKPNANRKRLRGWTRNYAKYVVKGRIPDEEIDSLLDGSLIDALS